MIKRHVFFNTIGKVQLHWSDKEEPTYTDQKPDLLIRELRRAHRLTGGAKSCLAGGQSQVSR